MRNFISVPLCFGCDRFVSTNDEIDEPQTEPGYLMWPYNREYSETERPLDIFQASVAGKPLRLDESHSSTIECRITDVACAEASKALRCFNPRNGRGQDLQGMSVNMIGVKKQ
jgi:hypothetical protein